MDNPVRYQIVGPGHVDCRFWVELDGNEGIPLTSNSGFYHPSKRARTGWVDYIASSYGIEPNIPFDEDVVILPGRIANAVQTAEDQHSRKIVIRDGDNVFEDSDFSFGDKERPEIYLRTLQAGIDFSDKKSKDLSDFEKKALYWREGYGFLEDRRHPKGTPKRKTYRITNEYYFHIPEYPDLVLSLAEEYGNSNAICGLKKSLFLDWPFDSPDNPRKPENVEEVVSKLNIVARCLESILT